MLSTEQQQCLLGALGFYTLRRKDGTLAIDGDAGPSTRAAIRAFQDAAGLKPDGIWGPLTEQAICQAVGKLAEPQPQEPVLEDQNVGQLLWDSLTAQGLPPEAVAGILGNLDAESGLIPINMEDVHEQAKGFTDQSYTQAIDDYNYPDFINDGVGYGLAQWTWPTRKQALLQYARDTGRSIGDAAMQTEFLIRELRMSYPDLLSRLMTCRDIREATVDFLTNFEQPLNQNQDIQDDRTERAQAYYSRYAGEPEPVTIWDDPRIKPYFKRSEFACPCPRCGGFPVEPAEDLVRACAWVRHQTERPFIISSGVRCQAHNDELPGSVPDSRHVRGRAVDFTVPGMTPQEIKELALMAPGIQYSYIMKSGWVHMDIGN